LIRCSLHCLSSPDWLYQNGYDFEIVQSPVLRKSAYRRRSMKLKEWLPAVTIFLSASSLLAAQAYPDALPAAQGKQLLPYKYVGNSFSFKFHRPSCQFARAMSLDHVVLFHFRRDAVGAGHRPCRWCLPPAWRTVEAHVLPRSDSQDEGEPQAWHDKPERPAASLSAAPEATRPAMSSESSASETAAGSMPHAAGYLVGTSSALK